MMKPVLQDLAQKNEFQQIGFKEIDVDRNSQIVQQLQIQGIPTFLITKDGQIIDQITGFIPEPL